MNRYKFDSTHDVYYISIISMFVLDYGCRYTSVQSLELNSWAV